MSSMAQPRHTRDERFGDARVGAVEVGGVGDVGFLADLDGDQVLAVARHTYLGVQPPDQYWNSAIGGAR
ncbi:MAG: hypothetical protein JO242_20200, partial [Streptosporangiaceae bacterium]|nr:hypothetical protein [Streptosporangiaceae bacterium]